MLTREATGPEAGFAGTGHLFWTIGIFSLCVNALMLTGPLYMLQIYDRVLPSRSEETLLALTILVAALYGFMGLLDYVRGRIAARIGATVQARLDARVFNAALRRSVLASERSAPASGLRDLEAIQKLMGSPVLFAVFDMPWAPVFMLAIYSFHPWLGHLSIVGGLVLVAVTLLNQMLTRKPELEATSAALKGDAYAETIRQQGEMIQAFGMRGVVLARWQVLRRRALSAQLASSDRVNQFSTISKTFRFFLQSAVLGLGAYLVLEGEMTAGAMVAGSILLGRALAPVEQAIGGWPLVLRARQGWASLKTLLASTPEQAAPTALPRPRALVEVNQITVFPPEQQKASLRLLDLRLSPGEALGVIGMSASGKSTLARVLTGVWRPASGSVRLDGAALDQYEPDLLGSYIGYLPQDVALFDGTVAENIGRMQPSPDAAQVVAAARKAGAHEMILGLPQGYDTAVSAGGARLSGGQKQRIGLARAFYGDPVLMVLDEPNSNLDAAGQEALNLAVRQAKAECKAVVIMAHRPAGIAECDLILIIDGGAARAFGPRDAVLNAHVRNHARVAGRIFARRSAIMNDEPGGGWRLRRFLLVGYLGVFTLVFGLGAWAAVARISGAVITAGTLEVQGNRQVVQHPVGGVIAAINARDGDPVAAGDVLIELEGQALVSEFGIVEGQWLEILARKSRLAAERDGLDAVAFDAELVARRGEAGIASLIAAQTQQFEARRKLQDEEAQQIVEQQRQIARQIEGLDALGASTVTQIELLAEELEGQKSLYEQGLTQVTRVLALERELARLRGTAGQVEATIAESRGKIAEHEIELVRLVSELREEAIAELRDLEFREIELRERRHSLKEAIARLDLRAPVAGVVYGSAADTLLGVIRAAEPVMYIVPKDAGLVVRGRIDPIHIDQVAVGQEAALHFTAFDRSTTPELTGHVTAVSADTFEDEALRQRYYRADIRLDDGMLEALGELDLVPGMPVEAFIKTADRSALNYFVRPLADYFARAFRDG